MSSPPYLRTSNRDYLVSEYLVYYACCDVLAKSRLSVSCWFCGEGMGLMFYEVFGNTKFPPYRESGSTTYMQGSKVDKRVAQWRNP